ncbi:preprotein translocase subunit SecE [Mucilaginibacter yixingensis]|uniref:Protein translocase subunit SecE n=1 Tax=Mucilaginibacter yixingensis TaxID=1295612 RepID=A0A2T5JCH9_9SPHI|nr:preprotein translocase subunit SecE [Mucilaginibacter yixingensis]PTQ99375.1 preprotein translocase subunit SecE [Mucilaginibacter yixingensis]
MAAVVEYIKESYIELTEKVTWPTWRELQSSGVLVVVAAIIIALIIFGMDWVINYLLMHFYNSLG